MFYRVLSGIIAWKDHHLWNLSWNDALRKYTMFTHEMCDLFLVSLGAISQICLSIV